MKQKLLHLFTVKKTLAAILLIAAFVLPLHIENYVPEVNGVEAADPAKVEECKGKYDSFRSTAGNLATQRSGADSSDVGKPGGDWKWFFNGEKTDVGWTTDNLSYYGTLVRDLIIRRYPARAAEVTNKGSADVKKVFESLPAADRNAINSAVQPEVKRFHKELYDAAFNAAVVRCENEVTVPTMDGPDIDLTSPEGREAINEAEAALTTAKKQGDEIYCLDTDKSPMLSWAGCTAQVAYVFLYFASWVLWLAAIFFNYTIDYTLNIADFLNKTQIVEVGWVTFRDFANLFFIFIILYIAISTIIGNSRYGIKDLLAKVIIAAILINFSLFFTKVIVDVSNIFALQFYNKITQSANSQAGDLDGGISAALASAMGMHTVMGIGSATKNSTGAEVLTTDIQLGLNPQNLIIVGFGGGIFVILTAIVFFAGALMLLARTLSLVFLMILSPFAFLGNVLPSTQKYASEWWSKLFQNAMFAPAYMALLYLVLSIILSGKVTSGSFIDMFAGKTGFVETFATFIILNGLMIGCLVVAQKLGATGAGFAMGMAKSVQAMAMGAGGAATFGAAALVSRNTVGRLADAYANSDMAKGAGNRFTRSFTRLSNKVANSSFDARQVGGIGKKMGIGSGDGKGIRQLDEDKKKAIIEDSKLFDEKGKTAYAKSLQGKWSGAKRGAGDEILKTAIADETAKEREAMKDYVDDPDYREALKLITKSASKDGLNAKEMQKMAELKKKYDAMGEVEEKVFIDDITSSDHGKWIKSGKKRKILDFSSHAPGKWSLTGDYVRDHGESGRNAAKYSRRKLYSESGREKFRKGNFTL